MVDYQTKKPRPRPHICASESRALISYFQLTPVLLYPIHQLAGNIPDLPHLQLHIALAYPYSLEKLNLSPDRIDPPHPFRDADIGAAVLCGILDEVFKTDDRVYTLFDRSGDKVDELEAEVEDIGDIVAAGQCGENAYYALYSSGKVLVKGTGAMYDYDLESNRSPFYRNDAVRSVVVSEGITTVGEDAFERCLNLESVSLPTSLTSIGSGAFMPADEYPSAAGKLNSITIPDTVTTIGGGAFWGAALTSLTVPHNVATVGKYACRDCTRLTSVRYEGSVIGGFMFVNCTALTGFTMAHTVTTIGEHCFNYCGALETITYEQLNVKEASL